MRTSALVTVSLPPTIVKEAERIARKQHMTRSEFVRAALRRYMEEHSAEEAIQAYKKEQREGMLKNLKGSIVDLMH